jgi:hypothetical protein
MTKKKTNLEKLLEYTGPNFMGNPTFGGTGNYGVGGYKQLAHFGLNPATEDIKEKTEEELEQNIKDQEWINNKYRRGFGFNADEDPVLHWNGRNGTVETVAENAAFDNSTSRMRDLPGFPAPNTLVEPKQFVPLNAGAEYENQIDGRKVEYLGPTLNGVPMDDMTGNSSALALQLSEEEEEPKTIDQKLNKLIGPDPDLSSGTEHEHDAADIVLYNLVEKVVGKYLMELLGAPKATTPDRLGWNNTRTNSLAAWRNHLNPDQPPTETWRPQFGENEEQNPSVDYVPAQRSPLSGFGAIGWPKQFIPQDYEVSNPDYEGFAEDPLGARRLRQSPTDDDRVGVNASIREAHMKHLEALLEYLLNEEACDEDIDEKFASQAQRRFFYAKAREGGKEGKKWKRLASEFESETPKDAKLPERIDETMLEEGIDEGENAPTNPSLWSRAKAAARSKFDVYPSAYANLWASKWYKSKGGGWRKKGKKK